MGLPFFRFNTSSVKVECAALIVSADRADGRNFTEPRYMASAATHTAPRGAMRGDQGVSERSVELQ